MKAERCQHTSQYLSAKLSFVMATLSILLVSVTYATEYDEEGKSWILYNIYEQGIVESTKSSECIDYRQNEEKNKVVYLNPKFTNKCSYKINVPYCAVIIYKNGNKFDDCQPYVSGYNVPQELLLYGKSTVHLFSSPIPVSEIEKFRIRYWQCRAWIKHRMKWLFFIPGPKEKNDATESTSARITEHDGLVPTRSRCVIDKYERNTQRLPSISDRRFLYSRQGYWPKGHPQ